MQSEELYQDQYKAYETIISLEESEKVILSKLKSKIGLKRSYLDFITILRIFYEMDQEHGLADSLIEEIFTFYFGDQDIDLIAVRICAKFGISNIHRKWLCEKFNVVYVQAIEALFDRFTEIIEASLMENLLLGELANPLCGNFSVMSEALLLACDQDSEKQAEIEWFELRDKAEKYQGFDSGMWDYLTEKIREYSDVASPPEWLSNSIMEDFEPQEPIFDGDEYSQNLQLLKYICTDQKSFNISKHVLKFQPYPPDSEERKIDMFHGLQNPILNTECCSGDGRCRMFRCNCNHPTDGVEFFHQAWFKGECSQCQRVIRSYYHALRYPLPEGGFGNPYCSEKCLFDSLKRLDQLQNYELVIRNPKYESPEYRADIERVKCFIKVLKDVKIALRE